MDTSIDFTTLTSEELDAVHVLATDSVVRAWEAFRSAEYYAKCVQDSLRDLKERGVPRDWIGRTEQILVQANLEKARTYADVEMARIWKTFVKNFTPCVEDEPVNA